MSDDATPAFTIRAQEPADAAAAAALVGRIGVVEGTLQIPDMPISSRLDYQQRIDPRDCKLVAMTAAGEMIGLAGLHSVQPSLRRNHVRLLAIAVAPQWQGRGVGRQLMLRLIDWADRWAGVLRIELNVHADNTSAIALYRSLGFAEEGRHRAYALKDGRYMDGLSMARLHPSPPQLGG
ncbi:GNAT family N-acetyltransferase [Ramlibacter sp.]|uniref:GNAT family N-acetyltransferase n=1 Tax=Ramlibacter sp. TaxID=1917967 RepID=UPI00181AEB21|nr:GNAT family N-acetyltransferase [Ramlibacter sp.]MBA2672915.1 GNAT family N-acetyltransferase [Ramlibacter sp.]